MNLMTSLAYARSMPSLIFRLLATIVDYRYMIDVTCNKRKHEH